MKHCIAACLSLFLLTAAAVSTAHSDIVVPNTLAGVEGDGSFSLTSTSTSRTYQMTIDASQLAGVVGHNLTGIQWRLNGAATAPWPAVNTSYSFFDVFIGPSVDPSVMSNTFAANFTGAPSQVRSGGFTWSAGAFSNGSSPNAFGTALLFNTPYLYTGGDLAIEFRFSTQSGATNQPSLDGVLASGGPGNGWGTTFNSRWTSSPAGGVGVNANFLVTNILSVQAIPEPTGAALVVGLIGLMFRRRSRS